MIACVFSDATSPRLGLNSFLYPQRSSNIPPDELAVVVLVGRGEFFKREWNYLHNFPEVYYINVSKI